MSSSAPRSASVGTDYTGPADSHAVFDRTSVPQAAYDSNPGLVNLLLLEPDFLQTIQCCLSDADWEALCLSPTEAEQWIELHKAAQLRVEHLSLDRYSALAVRPDLPIDAVEGLEHRIPELQEALAMTGFDAIAKRVIRGIHFRQPVSTRRAIGVIGDVFSQGLGHLEVSLSIPLDLRYRTLPILKHEVGHGFNYFLIHLKKGQEWFHRYAVHAFADPTFLTVYTQSFYLSYQSAEKGNRSVALQRFLQEAFAEDFRLYFSAPQRLSRERMALLDDMVSACFPDVDIPTVRSRFKTMTLLFYGRLGDDVEKDFDSQKVCHYATLRSNRDLEKKDIAFFETLQKLDLQWLNLLRAALLDSEPLASCYANADFSHLYYGVFNRIYDSDWALRQIDKRLLQLQPTPSADPSGLMAELAAFLAAKR